MNDDPRVEAAARYENRGTVAQRTAYICWLTLVGRGVRGWRYHTTHGISVWQPASPPDLYPGVR